MSYAFEFVIASGVLALLYGVVMIRSILSLSSGTEEMQKIAAAIQEGARAYLNRQYQMITLVGVIICALLTWLLGIYVGIGFLIGAILSGVAGYVGMNVSVRSNVRTTEAARSGHQPPLDVALQ